MEGLFAGGFNAASGGPLPTVSDPTKDWFWYIYSNGTVDGTDYFAGSMLTWATSTQAFDRLESPTFFQVRGKSDEATRWAEWNEVTSKPTNIVYYDTDKDITVRMVHSTYATQSAIPKGSGISFRVNSDTDNLTRFADVGATKDFLGMVRDSYKLNGKTLDEVKFETRTNLVPNSLTINGYRLDGNITLSAGDFGLVNVANYGNTSSPTGTSTTLYATQRCAYEASAAPRLADNRKRIVDVSELDPDPTAPDGIYIKYDKSARTYTEQIKIDGILYTKA